MRRVAPSEPVVVRLAVAAACVTTLATMGRATSLLVVALVVS
jgi:hypothetical protein